MGTKLIILMGAGLLTLTGCDSTTQEEREAALEEAAYEAAMAKHEADEEGGSALVEYNAALKKLKKAREGIKELDRSLVEFDGWMRAAEQIEKNENSERWREENMREMQNQILEEIERESLERLEAEKNKQEPKKSEAKQINREPLPVPPGMEKD